MRGKGTYKGNFLAGQFSGKGRLDYLDASWYEGSWKDSKMHGKGKYQDSTGEKIYEGGFKDG